MRTRLSMHDQGSPKQPRKPFKTSARCVSVYITDISTKIGRQNPLKQPTPKLQKNWEKTYLDLLGGYPLVQFPGFLTFKNHFLLKKSGAMRGDAPPFLSDLELVVQVQKIPGTRRTLKDYPRTHRNSDLDL